jgi:hypothetical protein
MNAIHSKRVHVWRVRIFWLLSYDLEQNMDFLATCLNYTEGC